MSQAITELLGSYQPSPDEIQTIRDVPTDLLTGITGAGKDTIISDILREAPNEYERVVTSTTRQPRENSGVMEQHGVNYYFLTLDEARQKMADGEYIEAAEVHGNIYGSLFSEYRRIAGLGKVAVGNIDYQGALNFLDFGMSKFSLYFVVPPNFEVWAARLAKRNGKALGYDKETMTRLHSAQKELNTALANEAFVPIINDISSETARRIIEYRQTGTQPSDEEIMHARQIIASLNQSITDFVGQFED